MDSALPGLSVDSSASVDGVGRVLDEVETRVAQVRLASDEMTWCGDALRGAIGQMLQAVDGLQASELVADAAPAGRRKATSRGRKKSPGKVRAAVAVSRLSTLSQTVQESGQLWSAWRQVLEDDADMLGTKLTEVEMVLERVRAKHEEVQGRLKESLVEEPLPAPQPVPQPHPRSRGLHPTAAEFLSPDRSDWLSVTDFRDDDVSEAEDVEESPRQEAESTPRAEHLMNQVLSRSYMQMFEAKREQDDALRSMEAELERARQQAAEAERRQREAEAEMARLREENATLAASVDMRGEALLRLRHRSEILEATLHQTVSDYESKRLLERVRQLGPAQQEDDYVYGDEEEFEEEYEADW